MTCIAPYAEPDAAADRGRHFGFWDSLSLQRPRLLSWVVRRMSIPSRDELPEDFEELRHIPIDLPRMPDDSAASCPVPMAEILEYLSYEAPGGEHSGSTEAIEFRLEFVRTAVVEHTRYWIWSFRDSRDCESYVTVGLDARGQLILSYDETFELSPEQRIMAEHYDFV